MNNLQSLFPLGLLLDRAVLFPQLLHLCHSHIPSMEKRTFFHTLPSDSNGILLMLPIQLEKGNVLMCVRELERENVGDQEESEGTEG